MKSLVLLWLGTQAARPALDADLDAWAAARWLRLAEPAADAPALPGHDDELVGRIEALLEQARIASGSLDDRTARERLAEVERELRAHPELPQAAWLLAEALELGARTEVRAGTTLGRELARRARVLEGPRSETFGAPAKDAPLELTPVSVVVRGLRRSDRLEWDGAASGGRLDTVSGEHHARVVRRERVIWAGWVTVGAGARELTLPLAPAPACSLDDLAGTRIRAGRVAAPSGVRCEHWAVAREAPGGGVEVATCHGSSCGPLLGWKRRYGAVYEGPPQPPPGPGFPVWATYALVGAGAVALGSVALWQSGAFDDPEPGRTRWVFYGPSR